MRRERVVIGVLPRTFKASARRGKPPITEPELAAYRDTLIRCVKSIGQHQNVRRIDVAVNCDPSSPFSEMIDSGDGTTLSERILLAKSNRFRVLPTVHKCFTWGQNSGSGAPMNSIINSMQNNGVTHVLVLSKEIILPKRVLGGALEMMAQQSRKLNAVGFYRQGWWEHLPQRVPQNTACLWRIESLLERDGFDPRCDGDGSTIDVGGQSVPIAGMEDFHLLLRQMKWRPDSFYWGMFGASHPLRWDVSAKNADELHRHQMKLRRQEYVMQQYVKELYPSTSWREVMEQFFRSRLVAA